LVTQRIAGHRDHCGSTKPTPSHRSAMSIESTMSAASRCVNNQSALLSTLVLTDHYIFAHRIGANSTLSVPACRRRALPSEDRDCEFESRRVRQQLFEISHFTPRRFSTVAQARAERRSKTQDRWSRFWHARLISVPREETTNGYAGNWLLATTSASASAAATQKRSRAADRSVQSHRTGQS
jgi:hypothetical protein